MADSRFGTRSLSDPDSRDVVRDRRSEVGERGVRVKPVHADALQTWTRCPLAKDACASLLEESPSRVQRPLLVPVFENACASSWQELLATHCFKTLRALLFRESVAFRLAPSGRISFRRHDRYRKSIRAAFPKPSNWLVRVRRAQRGTMYAAVEVCQATREGFCTESDVRRRGQIP